MKHFTAEQATRAIQKTASLLVREGVKVTTQGARAYCEWRPDGKLSRINLPMIPRDAKPEFLAALQGYLDHEVAHALYTNPKAGRDVVEAFSKESGIAKEVVHGMFNVVEDVRIEACMERDYRGSQPNLHTVREFFSETFTKPNLDAIDLDDPEATAKRRSYILPIFFRARGGQSAMIDFMDANGLWDEVKGYDEKFPDLADRLKALTSTEDAANLAAEILRTIKESKPPESSDKEEEPEEPEDEEQDEPGEDDGDSDGSNPDSENDQDNEDGEEDDDADASKPESEEDEDGEGGEGDADEDDDGDGEDEEGDAEPEDGDGEPDDGDEGEDDDSDADSDGGDCDEEESEADEEDDGESDSGSDGEAEEDESDEAGDSTEGEASDAGDSDDSEADSADGSSESDGEESEGEVEEAELDYDPSVLQDFDEAAADILEAAVAKLDTADEYYVFTRDNDKIGPAKISSTPPPLDRWEKEVEATTGTLRRELQRLIAAKTRAHHVPGHKRGRIHPGSLHKIMTGDDRLFSRKYEAIRKDTAFSLVVDLSGSMTGEKVKTALLAAWAFADTLDRLGVPCEVIGFTSLYNEGMTVYNSPEYKRYCDTLGVSPTKVRWEPLLMPIFKGFDEKFSIDCKRRIASAQGEIRLMQNIDGESVRIAAARLYQRREERKVMIVFSDGNPAAHLNQSALHNDMVKAVKEITAAGIETIGIGIEDRSVKAYYPKHFVINRVSELATTTLRQLKEVLAS